MQQLLNPGPWPVPAGTQECRITGMNATAAESRTSARACRNTGMQDHRNECNGC